MDITFVLCPNWLGILGLSILLVFTRFNFYLEEKQLNWFRAAAIVNLFIIIFEVVDYLLAATPFPSAYLFRRVTSATGFALSPIFPLLLAHIASKKKLPIWINFPAGVNAFISYVSIATGHLFWIDLFNSYYRGPLFIVMMLISCFYFILLIYLSMRNLQTVRTSEFAFLICIVVILVIANILEIMANFHFIIWNSCAILLICYYLYLHIQYFKYDPLTKVFNRSMFAAELEAMAHKGNVGVVSFDLDYLKKINDEKGHEYGDAYIVAAAKLIGECFSGAGRLYRIGGDEFVVLMANTTEEMIQNKIGQFRNRCLERDIFVSCGYSFCRSSLDLHQLLRDADKAMYENKRDREMYRKTL